MITVDRFFKWSTYVPNCHLIAMDIVDTADTFAVRNGILDASAALELVM